MNPLPHQQKFVKDYQGKNLIVWEGGTGKTIVGCLWLRDGKDSYALVVCPKRVKAKWLRSLKEWDTKATVVTKEEFKKTALQPWSAIVIDEADEFASPLFAKGRSKLTERMYEVIRHTNCPRLLLTATPIRSTPWNLHTLLTFSGVYIDWKLWRSRFFSLEKRPYLPRPAWIPKPNWKKDIVPVLEKYADIVNLRDCVDILPPVTHEVIHMKSKPFKPTEWDAKAEFHEEHRHEQSGKPEKILEIGKEYRKVLVVAYYVEQTEELYKQLQKDGREVFMINGKVKDQEKVIQEATESPECYFIVQSSIGAGFDADSFSCVIFASMDYSVRNYTQMLFRVRRIHNLHPVIYYYLIAGRCDQAIKKNIDSGKDFVPALWEQDVYGTTRSTKTV